MCLLAFLTVLFVGHVSDAPGCVCPPLCLCREAKCAELGSMDTTSSPAAVQRAQTLAAEVALLESEAELLQVCVCVCVGGWGGAYVCVVLPPCLHSHVAHVSSGVFWCLPLQ